MVCGGNYWGRSSLITAIEIHCRDGRVLSDHGGLARRSESACLTGCYFSWKAEPSERESEKAFIAQKGSTTTIRPAAPGP